MTTQHYERPTTLSAFDARFEAIKLSFAPVAFQIAYALYHLNILQYLFDHGDDGAEVGAIAKALNISEYGVKVLLDMGLSCHIVWLKDENHYVLDKIGYFILTDKMVQVNFEFMQECCYQGLYYLIDSIKQGKPEGLKVFGAGDTIYPMLSKLPEKAKKSWFEFDHYYSDESFRQAHKQVFSKPVKHLMDIGGNTGKWALYCFEQDPTVKVTIVDLPPQLAMAKANIAKAGFEKRFDVYACDMLDKSAHLPKHHDVIWLSQFLDCFSLDQIKQILEKVYDVMDENTVVYILELFWDRQSYEPAAFSLNATSLYFTVMANGNSRMYHSRDFLRCVESVGLHVESITDGLGMGHTLLCCRKG